MVHMSCAYLMEKQMPRSFWYFAIRHAASMMNVIPGSKLASPFMLIRGERPDQRAWLPIFSFCYFHHENNSDASRSKNQAHTLDGIIVGHDPTSMAVLVYNPHNQKYYKPDSYRINPYCLPSSVYSTIKYDGGLFVSLHRDEIALISEPFPPGTRVAQVHPKYGRTLLGTVMDIPLDPNTSLHYLILFNDGKSSSIPAAEMPDLIPKPSVDVLDNTHLLPPFLKVGSKITFDKDGQYHKGFLSCLPDGSYQISYKSHINKKHEDWGIFLPDLATRWQDLCAKGLLLPGHGWSSFDRSASANHVSAWGLISECLHSLLSALNPNHPDREVWLESFCEEKRGIESLDTYDKILLAEYCALREKGAPRAIPTMCVLTIKKDKMMNPHRAKSCIIVLGNHEDRVWTKPEKYAPVLRPDSLRLMVSMATERHTVLKQGDCKNAFCQGILLDDEITIVKPPIGDPDAKKDEYWLLKRTLYGLCRSPRHWYTKINAALNAIRLHDNSSNLCLYTGHIIDPSTPDAAPALSPLTLGLYMDEFVYFSDDPYVE